MVSGWSYMIWPKPDDQVVGWLLAKAMSVRVTAWHVSHSPTGWLGLAQTSGFQVQQVGTSQMWKHCSNLLESHLLLSHWPKSSTWLNPKWVWKELPKGMDTSSLEQIGGRLCTSLPQKPFGPTSLFSHLRKLRPWEVKGLQQSHTANWYIALN